MIDEKASYCTKEIEHVLHRRESAVQRLKNFEFWMQTINIYYSCFTAAISILSLYKAGSFLSLPSTMFTVMVAILVTYANSQKCGERANDLQTNCNDLTQDLHNIKLCESNDELKRIMNDFHKHIGDSESGSVVDKWGSVPKLRYYVLYVFPVSLLIVALFLIPILFFILNWDSFMALFKSMFSSTTLVLLEL